MYPNSGEFHVSWNISTVQVCNGYLKTPQPQLLTSTTFDDDRYSRYTKSRTQILTKPLTNFFEKSSKVPQKLRKRFQDYIKNVRKRLIEKC